jgi:DDE family transposase
LLLERLCALGAQGISLRLLGGERAGEVQLGRLLNNPRVTSTEMTATARADLLGRVAGRHVLAIQDSTSLRDDGDKQSLYLHPTIAVDAAAGALLGLLTAAVLERDGRPKEHCNKRSLEEKESCRWVDATRQAEDLLAAGAAAVTMVEDREADFYEAFACRPERVDVVARVHHNRNLVDGSKLYDACQRRPELGRIQVDLPATPQRKARSATLAMRACVVRIKRPKRNRAAEAAKLPPTLSLTLVEACEVDPPADVAAVHWRLLSTHPATTLAAAARIIGFYRCRWQIEQVFRVMKTDGFDIEAVPLRHNRSLKNLACATLIAAIQIQQMVHDRDGQANRPMTDVFAPADQPVIESIGQSLEGKTERQKNPHPSGSLAHAAWICARLGGWTGYGGKPGPIVLVRGLVRLQAMLEGIKRFELVRMR